LPRYATELAAHERWWQLIHDTQAHRGAPSLTFNLEVLPPPYQQVDHVTGAPTADAIEVNNWLADRLRSRYRSST
jgi:hypothetical protein